MSNEYTTHLHFQEIREKSSLLENAESNCQAPPITIQISAFNTGGFHSLVMSPVGAMQNNMLDSRANPTKRVSHRGMRKKGEENEPEQTRHALASSLRV